MKFVSTSSETFGSTETPWVKLMNSVGGAVFRAPEPGTRVLLLHKYLVLTVQAFVSKKNFNVKTSTERKVKGEDVHPIVCLQI